MMSFGSTSMVVMMLGALVLFSACSLTGATKKMYQPEREALLRWKASFIVDYGPWLWNASSTSPCDDWDGITCNEEGRVIGIDLSKNYYYYCYEAMLNNFSFSSFPFLSSLTLSKMLNGTIPHGIGALSRLTHLDLSHNDLSGELPISFANLSSLTHLDLSSNRFSGKLPVSFPNLTQLIHLNLSHNAFEGEVPSFLHMTKLTLLDLSFNSFSGQLPPTLINCMQLTVLKLQSNFFTGDIPPGCGYLKNLTLLILSNNKITGPIPAGPALRIMVPHAI